MSLVVWIAIGLVCGLLADLAVRSYGVVEDVSVGIAGSIVAGWVFVAMTSASVTSISLLGSVSAFVGATAFIALSRGLTRGRGVI